MSQAMNRLRANLAQRRADALAGEDLFSEVEDIRADASFESEITDPEPDFERSRASIHRGDNYFHLTPGDTAPWTATSGQEGGIAPSYHEQERVDVFGAQKGANMQRVSDIVFGSAYERGHDVLGAGMKKIVAHAPPRGFVQKTTAQGRKFTALVVNPTHPVDHKASIANARAASKRSVSVGKKVQAAILHHATKTATKVHGALPPPRRTLPKRGVHHRMTPAQIKKAADNAVKLGQDLSKHADKHETLIKTTTAQTKTGVSKVKSATAPGSTGFHGDVVHGSWSAARRSVATDVLGLTQVVTPGTPGVPPTLPGGYATDPSLTDGGYSSAAPDPMNPGYLTDGNPDPNYYGDGTLDPSLDPSQNYGLGDPPTAPPPLQPGVDYAPDSSLPGGGYQNDDTVYHSGGDITKLVAGAVVYDGSHPLNTNDVASYVAIYGPARGGAGTGEGVEPEDPNSNDYKMGLKWRGGFRFKNDGWWYNWGGDNQHGSEGNSKQAMGAGPHHWGPLVGNPQTDFKGLRYDVDTDTFWWPRDLAPAWATMADDQARLAKAILDYKTQYTNAAANAAAQAAQDQLDAQNAAQLAKQQAVEDAAMQRQADVQSQQQAIAQQAADAGQAQFDQQQAQQQAQLDLEAQKAQQELDVQQAQVDLQLQQAQVAYAQQHPDAFFAPDQADQEQYADQGDAGATEGRSDDEARAVLEDDSVPDSVEGAWWQGEGGLGAWRRGETVTGYMRGSDKIRARRTDRRG